MPRSKEPRSLLASLVRFLLLAPVYAIPFAIFFGVLFGASVDAFKSALAEQIAAIKGTPRQEGIAEIRIPGERSYRERARLSREGIEIDRKIYDALGRLAEGQHNYGAGAG